MKLALTGITPLIGLITLLASGLTRIADVIAVPIGWIAQIVAAALTFITNLDSLKSVVTDLVEQAFTDAWNAIYDVVSDVVSKTEAFLQAAWDTITGVVKTVWTAISSFFTSWWNTLYSLFSTIVQKIITFLQTSWGTITNAVKSAWAAISSFFTGWWSTLSSAFSLPSAGSRASCRGRGTRSRAR